MTTLVMFVILTIEDIQLARGKGIPELEDNLFRKNNIKLQTVMNKLFTSFGIKTNFSTNKKIKVLLTMHDNLMNISDNNFKVNKDIGNISKAMDNTNESSLFNLTEIIEELFESMPNFSRELKRKYIKNGGENDIKIDWLHKKRKKSYNLKIWRKF